MWIKSLLLPIGRASSSVLSFASLTRTTVSRRPARSLRSLAVNPAHFVRADATAFRNRHRTAEALAARSFQSLARLALHPPRTANRTATAQRPRKPSLTTFVRPSSTRNRTAPQPPPLGGRTAPAATAGVFTRRNHSITVICVVSDTHGTDGHRLAGRTLEAVRAADCVVHAGDFTAEAALDGFETEAHDLRAVHGNNATPAVRERLPAERTIEFDGAQIALTHGDRRDDTGLELFGREAGADLVIFGHSHEPLFTDAGEVGLLNPGSHADPRWNRPAHAELDPRKGVIDGRLCDPDGAVFETFSLR